MSLNDTPHETLAEKVSFAVLHSHGAGVTVYHVKSSANLALLDLEDLANGLNINLEPHKGETLEIGDLGEPIEFEPQAHAQTESPSP